MKKICFLNKILINKILFINILNGDWGLGIGD